MSAEENTSPLHHMKAARSSMSRALYWAEKEMKDARVSLGRALYWAEKEYYSTEVLRLLIRDVDKVLKKMDGDYYELEGKA